MALIRSGLGPPVRLVRTATSADEHEYLDWLDSYEAEEEALAYEESLPDQLDEWGDFERPWDAYDEMSYDNGDIEVDDRPDWEQNLFSSCERCSGEAVLDVSGTCFECRSRDGRCSWCGLDGIAYPTEGACRTCYRRLRRANVTSVTATAAFAREMRNLGFRRADLRKRRCAAPG